MSGSPGRLPATRPRTPSSMRVYAPTLQPRASVVSLGLRLGTLAGQATSGTSAAMRTKALSKSELGSRTVRRRRSGRWAWPTRKFGAAAYRASRGRR